MEDGGLRLLTSALMSHHVWSGNTRLSLVNTPNTRLSLVRAIGCRGQPGAGPGRRQEEGQVQHRASLQTRESQRFAKTSEKGDLES